MVTDSTLGTEISDESKYYTLFKDTIYCKLTWIINLFQLLVILRQEKINWSGRSSC